MSDGRHAGEVLVGLNPTIGGVLVCRTTSSGADHTMTLGRLVALAFTLVFVGVLPSAAAGAGLANELVTSSGPLVSYGVSPDLACQASYSGDVHGEFFGETACATVIAASDGLYAPASIPAGSSLTGNSVPFTPVSQSNSGAGTSRSPYAVTTTVQAGALRLTQVDSYTVGSSRLQTLMTITNTGFDTTSFSVFRAGDCYARDSDTGYGQMAPQSAACVSSVEARTVRFLATPSASQPSALTWQGFFDDLWSRIATFAPGSSPADFDGTCRCAENIDNSAGLQWKLSLGAGQQTTIRSAIDFGPIAASGGFGTPSALAPGGKPYVALGDSYSSGEGAGDQRKDANYDYLAGTDVPGGPRRGGPVPPKNLCHRSANAYPVLVASMLSLDPASDFDFRACSGVVVADLRTANHGGNAGEDAQENHLGANTQLVTLTIGGNDAHFAEIVKACVTPNVKQHVSCSTSEEPQVLKDYAALSALSGPQSLLQAYQEIIDKIPSSATLVVFGYPDFTPFNGGCQTADRFSPSESLWLSGWIRRFNSLIEERAAMAGAFYVDVDRLYQPPNATSHRVCSGDEWINGIRRLGATESFHPNKLGQQAFADAFSRRYLLGQSNEALSGSVLPLSREDEITPAVSLQPTTAVLTKGITTSLGVDASEGHTTVVSLRYAGATPTYSLRGADGLPVPIGSLTAGTAPAGASSAVVGDTTVLELRGLPAGHYSIEAQLPDGAPTDAGVLSARFSSVAERNEPPIVSVSASISRSRRLRASALLSVDPEGAPLSFKWRFGDGTSSTAAAPTHRYRRPGRFKLVLSVKDASGLEATHTLVADTRPQRIAGLRVHRIKGSRGVRVTVACSGGTAIESCDGQVTVTARPKRGRRVVRQLSVFALRRRADTETVPLPGSRRHRFAGSITVIARVADQAIRPAQPQAVTSTVRIK